MSTVLSFLFAAGYILGAVRELARCGLRFGWALLLPKAVLAARVLAAESQLVVALNHAVASGKHRRRRFTPAFRPLWVALSKVLQGWEDLVHPQTLLHRRRAATFVKAA